MDIILQLAKAKPDVNSVQKITLQGNTLAFYIQTRRDSPAFIQRSLASTVNSLIKQMINSVRSFKHLGSDKDLLLSLLNESDKEPREISNHPK